MASWIAPGSIPAPGAPAHLGHLLTLGARITLVTLLTWITLVTLLTWITLVTLFTWGTVWSPFSPLSPSFTLPAITRGTIRTSRTHRACFTLRTRRALRSSRTLRTSRTSRASGTRRARRTSRTCLTFASHQGQAEGQYSNYEVMHCVLPLMETLLIRNDENYDTRLYRLLSRVWID